MKQEQFRKDILFEETSQELDQAVFAKVYPVLEKKEKSRRQFIFTSWGVLGALAASFTAVFFGVLQSHRKGLDQDQSNPLSASFSPLIGDPTELDFLDPQSVDFQFIAELNLPIEEPEIWNDLEYIQHWEPELDDRGVSQKNQIKPQENQS